MVLFVCSSGSIVPVETLQLNHLLLLSQHDLALRSKENTKRIIIYVEAAMSSGLGKTLIKLSQQSRCAHQKGAHIGIRLRLRTCFDCEKARSRDADFAFVSSCTLPLCLNVSLSFLHASTRVLTHYH